jgi:hypothetical protein
MTITTTTFTIRPIPDAVLDELRRETSADPVAHVTAEGGEPVRCCLRDARAGEQLLLVNYEPPLPPTPYRETGAIFIHTEACTGPAELSAYPADWYGRPQVLRAYDERGWIHPSSTTHDGRDPEAAIAAVLAHPAVVQVHSRNISYGCYMFAITR